MRYYFFISCFFVFGDLALGQNQFSFSPNPQGIDTIYNQKDVDKKPGFPGGEATFRAIYVNVRYPADAREHRISGTVITRFIVERDGSITSPEIVQSVFPSLDAEAIRVFSSITEKMQPAYVNGMPVRCFYQHPLKFVLQ